MRIESGLDIRHFEIGVRLIQYFKILGFIANFREFASIQLSKDS